MSRTASGRGTYSLLCLLTHGFAAGASAQLLQHKDLSYAMAKTIAETALENCRGRGYAVAVVVVDRAGDTIIALRADNAAPHTMENARRKASTARSFGTTTAEFAKRMATKVIAIAGGVPIRVGDELIGGVGVSGSPGVDESWVMPGLKKVQEQLA